MGQRMDFAGKAVLISGATSGIGRATALAFAERGANLMLGGRDAERGKAVCKACADKGAKAHFLVNDVMDEAAPAVLVAAALAQFGRLDVAFNNAGAQEKRGLLAEQGLEVYDRIFQTNLRAAFLAMQAQINAMLAGGQPGVIINTASVSGVRNPNPGLSIYSASKAALLSLTRAAAMEYAPKGIRINAVSPGRVKTPMMLGSGIADMKAVADALPLRRMGEPEEVAAAVVWLASDAAAYMVGHNLCLDGGFLAQ